MTEGRIVPQGRQENPGRAGVWRDLIGRCAARDESALSALYDESCRYVHGVAWSILRDASDAEEVTLDVYAQVWRNASSYTAERGSVACWLITLARNRAIDKMRAKGPKRWEELLPAFDLEADPEESPEQSMLFTERRDRISAAIRTLDPGQRQVVELAFFTGLTHTELAEHLGLPLGTVKGRLRAAMTALRQALEGRV